MGNSCTLISRLIRHQQQGKRELSLFWDGRRTSRMAFVGSTITLTTGELFLGGRAGTGERKGRWRPRTDRAVRSDPTVINNDVRGDSAASLAAAPSPGRERRKEEDGRDASGRRPTLVLTSRICWIANAALPSRSGLSMQSRRRRRRRCSLHLVGWFGPRSRSGARRTPANFTAAAAAKALITFARNRRGLVTPNDPCTASGTQHSGDVLCPAAAGQLGRSAPDDERAASWQVSELIPIYFVCCEGRGCCVVVVLSAVKTLLTVSVGGSITAPR